MPDKNERKFLGIKIGDWAKMAIALVGMLLLGSYTWAVGTRDDLRTVTDKQAHHEEHGHDVTIKAINEIEKIQAVQAETLINIEKGIGRIEGALAE